MTQVLETEMYDGVDLIHNWKSVKHALNSGRFDYLYEDLEMYDLTEEDIKNCKSVEELINMVGYPFILQKL